MKYVDFAGLLNSGLGFGMGQEEGGALAVSFDSVYLTLMMVIGILGLIMILLIFISANLVNLIRAREGDEPFTFSGTMSMTLRILKNRYVAVLGNFVVLMVIASFLTVTARGVGLHQGYQPDQPIKYSHALHAGKYEIDCQYCHSGASKGKNAWIPSVNVCMNCHKVIKDGPKYGTEEIAKVIKAYEDNEPIEWVRIHNLPDHAYFNHQQHVVVGKVECQTCHGPVQEMEEVYQFSPLSMGWCIDCHKTTEVDKDVYKALGRRDADRVKTAEDIGATNCARCHY